MSIRQVSLKRLKSLIAGCEERHSTEAGFENAIVILDSYLESVSIELHGKILAIMNIKAEQSLSREETKASR